MKIPQYNVRWLGALIEALYLVLPMLSIMSFMSMMAILYNQMRPYLLEHLPWVTFWMFILAAIIIVCIALLAAWIFIIPSIWALRGQQMFGRETRVEGDGEHEIQGTREEYRADREANQRRN